MIEQLIAEHQKVLGELDKDIVAYMLENKEVLHTLSITDLAEKTFTSKSTVLCLVKKLGFSGYSEFKYALRQEHNKQKVDYFSDSMSLQLVDIMKTLDLLEKVDFTEIFELIHNAKIIYAYGTGSSQRRILSEFATLLVPLGKTIIVIPNKTELDLTMPVISNRDAFIVASLSGSTQNIQANFLALELRKVPIISISRLGDNFMNKHSDYAIHYQTTPFQFTPNQTTDSLMPLNVTMDYIYRKIIDYNLRR